jgi:nucleoside-triphosphatase THEP1
MALAFKKATKANARLRLGLIGPAGSGKTYSALRVAAQLGSKIAVIDTERGSASKYADEFTFDVLELESFSPETYVDAIEAAEKAGYDVIVIDSLSHAWVGKDGALEQKDNASRKDGNSYTAWRSVTPKHNEMVDAILRSRTHVIATLRAKTEYVQEKDERGKTVVRKVGLAPVQRDGLEYEFDIVGVLNDENEMVISKTRCSALAGKVISKPGEKFADVVKAWLGDGPVPERAVGVTVDIHVPDYAALIATSKTKADLDKVGALLKDAPDEIKVAQRPAFNERQFIVHPPAWIAHIAKAENAFEIANAYIKRQGAFEQAGTDEVALAATVDALSKKGTADPIAFINTQSSKRKNGSANASA